MASGFHHHTFVPSHNLQLKTITPSSTRREASKFWDPLGHLGRLGKVVGAGAVVTTGWVAAPKVVIASDFSDVRDLSDEQRNKADYILYAGVATSVFVMKRACDKDDREEKKRIRSEVEKFKQKKAEFFNVTGNAESDDDIMASLRKAKSNVTLSEADGKEGGGEEGGGEVVEGEEGEEGEEEGEEGEGDTDIDFDDFGNEGGKGNGGPPSSMLPGMRRAMTTSWLV